MRGVAFNSGKKPIKLLKQLINYHPNANATILDFFAGSGSTGHAVLSLNKEDGGKRKFIIATNSEVIDSTYLRMQNVSNDLPMNLKYFDTDFVIKENFPDVSLEYELLKYITPLVELEFAVDIANPKVQIVITDEQLESLIKNNELVAHSTLFMHPDIFRDAEQSQILSDLQIKVQEIPNYFFGMELWSK
ncbi:DNA methyltransferase [Streptococcus iniae]